MDLRGRSLASLLEYTSEETAYILDVAARVKSERSTGIYPRRLANTNIALIFLKPSCRTRMSFVVAASDEGAHLEIFPAEDIRLGIKESIKDVARVLGRLFDGVAFRGFDHEVVEQLVEHAGVPVWNGLCDRYHPTQALADLMTIRELFGSLDGVSVACVGDGRNNQARSLAIAAAKTGLDLRLLSPDQLQLTPAELADLVERAGGSSGQVLVTNDPRRALEGAAVVYGDVWVSMVRKTPSRSEFGCCRD
jgi:ornithine carbamoyltransferase